MRSKAIKLKKEHFGEGRLTLNEGEGQTLTLLRGQEVIGADRQVLVQMVLMFSHNIISISMASDLEDKSHTKRIRSTKDATELNQETRCEQG